MRKQSYPPLESMIERYESAQEQVRIAQETMAKEKMGMLQLAVDQNLLDCITVDVNKLKRYM